MMSQVGMFPGSRFSAILPGKSRRSARNARPRWTTAVKRSVRRKGREKNGGKMVRSEAGGRALVPGEGTINYRLPARLSSRIPHMTCSGRRAAAAPRIAAIRPRWAHGGPDSPRMTFSTPAYAYRIPNGSPVTWFNPGTAASPAAFHGRRSKRLHGRVYSEPARPPDSDTSATRDERVDTKLHSARAKPGRTLAPLHQLYPAQVEGTPIPIVPGRVSMPFLRSSVARLFAAAFLSRAVETRARVTQLRASVRMTGWQVPVRRYDEPSAPPSVGRCCVVAGDRSERATRLLTSSSSARLYRSRVARI